MSDLGIVLLAIYIIVLVLCAAFAYMEVNGLNPSGWVKVIFLANYCINIFACSYNIVVNLGAKKIV